MKIALPWNSPWNPGDVNFSSKKKLTTFFKNEPFQKNQQKISHFSSNVYSKRRIFFLYDRYHINFQQFFLTATRCRRCRPRCERGCGGLYFCWVVSRGNEVLEKLIQFISQNSLFIDFVRCTFWSFSHLKYHFFAAFLFKSVATLETFPCFLFWDTESGFEKNS